VKQITVKKGTSKTDLTPLADLYVCAKNGSSGWETTSEKWTWENGKKYTIMELPAGSDAQYPFEFDSLNDTMANNYTFTYKQDKITELNFTNVQKAWKLEVIKTDETEKKLLNDAVFAIYSTNEKDPIKADYSQRSAGLNPKTTVEVNGKTWYLMDIQTTASNGTVSWADLQEESYYILELKAPDGYCINEEAGQVVKSDTGTGTKDVTVTNTSDYVLPASGGPGTVWYTLGGLLLIICSIIIFITKERVIR
jgi:hypothetical protein